MKYIVYFQTKPQILNLYTSELYNQLIFGN